MPGVPSRFILIYILEPFAMARKARETEGPSRRRKRNSETPAARAPAKKKRSPVVTIILVAVMMFIAWATLVKDDGKVPSGKIGPAIVGVLDQVYLGCTVYWFNQGSHLPCGQDIADKLHDSKNAEIKVTVSNSLRKEFSAVGKHITDRIVFRVDSDGEIYIKAKECETNIKDLVVSEVILEELEAQCKPK
ncbi:MAG: hypothetical protein HOA32_10750 [Nitrospina sp.]|jgi:hypothetical protein|nr:hypothetical protein [Nitrospina sp.]MBT4048756.1 hypothetical protein [Nitrospina sp.]MBT4556556.1 hypothetical protein [Nitrospina sp.]MBT5347420.1 hypothetical protein [Nitrospina sp.]MBT5652689.1 hypothetical protein [Nitrospina sp.]